MVERTCHGFETLDLKTFGTRRIFGLVGNFERVVFLNLISMSLQHYILNKDLQNPFKGTYIGRGFHRQDTLGLYLVSNKFERKY